MQVRIDSILHLGQNICYGEIPQDIKGVYMKIRSALSGAMVLIAGVAGSLTAGVGTAAAGPYDTGLPIPCWTARNGSQVLGICENPNGVIGGATLVGFCTDGRFFYHTAQIAAGNMVTLVAECFTAEPSMEWAFAGVPTEPTYSQPPATPAIPQASNDGGGISVGADVPILPPVVPGAPPIIPVP
ncbi:MAG: hypothetical protein ACRCSF_13260 [Mycobacteriaceae bacterium]